MKTIKEISILIVFIIGLILIYWKGRVDGRLDCINGHYTNK